MTDRDEMERDLINLIGADPTGALFGARVLIARGWQRIKGEGEADPADALAAIPDAAVQPVVDEETPLPTLRQSVAELREIAKDGDFPTLEELDEIRHGPSPACECGDKLCEGTHMKDPYKSMLVGKPSPEDDIADEVERDLRACPWIMTPEEMYAPAAEWLVARGRRHEEPTNVMERDLIEIDPMADWDQ